jgi:hypothetical protein
VSLAGDGTPSSENYVKYAYCIVGNKIKFHGFEVSASVTPCGRNMSLPFARLRSEPRRISAEAGETELT